MGLIRLDSYTDITLPSIPSIQTVHDKVGFTWKIDVTYMNGNYTNVHVVPAPFLDCDTFVLHYIMLPRSHEISVKVDVFFFCQILTGH